MARLGLGLVLTLTLAPALHALTDFTLSCQRGYRVTGIRRLNSAHQSKAGSLSIECQSIVDADLDSVGHPACS